MARRIGFVSTMNAIARDSARRQRQEETEKKRQERTLIQAARNSERANKLLDKENKQRYLEGRIEETAESNVELVEKIDNQR